MGFGAYHRQGGLPRIGAQTRVTPGRYTGVAYVLQVFERDWRATLRDCTHDELQPHKAKVIGPILPPVHAPDDEDNPIFSIALYGFFGGRREDSWCIPVHNQQFTSEERAANSFFLRLLGIDARIGKLGDDTVYEIVAGDGRFLLNLTTGAMILAGADGTAKIEIEGGSGGGKIHISCTAGSTVELDDGTGAVAMLKLTEHNTHVSTKYTPHKHTVPMVGSTGPPDLPGVSATGTTVAKGK